MAAKKLYRIFAGLSGGFGGATEYGIEEFTTDQDAMDYAYEVACNEYESYGGLHGLFNEEDALDENPDLSQEELDAMYEEDREYWIDYWVAEVDDDIEDIKLIPILDPDL